MTNLDEYDEIWIDYYNRAKDIQQSIVGRPLTENLLDTTRVRFLKLHEDFRAREPLLPYIDAWINPREGTFCLIVRPS